MAYVRPKDLDEFLPHLHKADTKFRQQLGQDLLAYLAEPSNPISCLDIGQFVDGLVPWMQSSNYKVSSNGIEVMTFLADRLGHDFRPYIQTVLPAVVDRLGDAKDTVREKAQLFILKILERDVLTPQSLVDRLTPSFTHKNAKIREEVLRCLVSILNEHGAHSVSLNKVIPHIIKMLSDSTATVRDTAFLTVVDLYKHVGDKLRLDIQRRNLVPAQKLPALLARFDDVKNAGELLTTASYGLELLNDDVDKAVMAKPIVPVKKAGLGSALLKTPTTSTVKTLATTPVNSAGAVDEDSFIRSFEDVPTVQLFSAREVADHMKGIMETISDVTKDWNKRVDALKKIRSIICAGGTNYGDFQSYIKQMEHSLVETCKDLRSQVVREACVTIAYLAQTLTSKFDRTAEYLLGTIINLIQNSAKIIATSGLTCMRFIIQHCQSPRLIPIVAVNLSQSKSKEIRRSCCEFLELMLTQWPPHLLEKHASVLLEAIKKGIADADPDARVSARRAFRGFKEHFPEQAELLLQSLEPSYRRALQGDLCLSSSSSSGSLAAYKATSRQYRPPTAQSTTGSTENLLQRAPSLPRSYRQRSGIPVLSNLAKRGVRSNSAIDLQAAQRAKSRAQYAAMTRNKAALATASLHGDGNHQARPRKSPEVSSMHCSERIGRTRSRSSVSVSHSQPTSRSASPSAAVGYHHHRTPASAGSDGDSPRPRRLSSGIPRSTAGSREASRETSPTRGGSRFRGGGAPGGSRPPRGPPAPPRSVMAQKILQQSREAENALADALTLNQTDGNNDHLQYNSPRKTLRSLDNHSDDSETSSVCSERSFDSYRRPSDSYSWSGSQQRLTSREPCRDINEIINCCASTMWQERKEGLVSLRHYLQSGNLLTPGELKYVTEIFTRMFMDSHTKGISAFLDTLSEIVRRHHPDLLDWLYVLLQRIFHKMGSDLLTSAHTKLLNTLDEIRTHFPVHLQVGCVARFLVDATQTPNARTKVAVLNYLTAAVSADDRGLPETGDVAAALRRVVAHAQDPKSAQTRHAAAACLVAAWNCDAARVTLALAELPRDQQEVASGLVRAHMDRGGSEAAARAASEPASPLLSPPHFNQEEVYRSLRRTTAEIQNYSYETLGSKLDREKDTTSQDSGISQMSNDARAEASVVRAEADSLQDCTITSVGNGAGADSIINGFSKVDDTDGGESLIAQVLEHCIVDSPTPSADKRKYLAALTDTIKSGDTKHIIPHFKKLFRLLLDHLERRQDSQTQVVVLRAITEIFNNADMKSCWSNYILLFALRVLKAHCDEKREVVKEAEITAAAVAVAAPPGEVITVIIPLIQTTPYPQLQGVIKMLTKLVETHGADITDDHLAKIMPGLVAANDNEESTVRKSAVFCMVALHRAVGEERLAPFVSKLSGSKLKLLRLYIGRAAAQQTSAPTSPKGGAPPASAS